MNIKIISILLSMPEKIFSALNQTFLHFAKCILMIYKMEIKIFSKK